MKHNVRSTNSTRTQSTLGRAPCRETRPAPSPLTRPCHRVACIHKARLQLQSLARPWTGCFKWRVLYCNKLTPSPPPPHPHSPQPVSSVGPDDQPLCCCIQTTTPVLGHVTGTSTALHCKIHESRLTLLLRIAPPPPNMKNKTACCWRAEYTKGGRKEPYSTTSPEGRAHSMRFVGHVVLGHLGERQFWFEKETSRKSFTFTSLITATTTLLPRYT